MPCSLFKNVSIFFRGTELLIMHSYSIVLYMLASVLNGHSLLVLGVQFFTIHLETDLVVDEK